MSRWDCIKMIFVLIFMFVLPQRLRKKFTNEVIEAVKKEE